MKNIKQLTYFACVLLVGLVASASLVSIADAGPRKQEKALVTICHKGNTIQVASAAVAAHVAHGDRIGPCGPPCPPNCNR